MKKRHKSINSSTNKKEAQKIVLEFMQKII
jgi:hypothetical protein